MLGWFGGWEGWVVIVAGIGLLGGLVDEGAGCCCCRGELVVLVIGWDGWMGGGLYLDVVGGWIWHGCCWWRFCCIVLMLRGEGRRWWRSVVAKVRPWY